MWQGRAGDCSPYADFCNHLANRFMWARQARDFSDVGKCPPRAKKGERPLQDLGLFAVSRRRKGFCSEMRMVRSSGDSTLR